MWYLVGNLKDRFSGDAAQLLESQLQFAKLYFHGTPIASSRDSRYSSYFYIYFLFSVRRALQYPKYEYRLIVNIVYAPKYNCYFALGKDFSLKVRNIRIKELCFVR